MSRDSKRGIAGRTTGALLAFAFVAAVGASTSGANAAGDDQAATLGALAASNGAVIEVRFREAAEVRGANTQLTAASANTTNRIDALFNDIGATNAEPLAAGISQAKLDRLADRAAARSGGRSPSMASWYRVTLAGPADVPAALRTLRESNDVVYADPAPEPVPPPATPDFSPQQLYLDPAPVGTDAEFALADPRTRGAGLKVVDLEYYWTEQHEDLLLPPSTDLGGGTYVEYTAFADEHGTAVFGIIAAADNGFGVTGGAPDAQMHGISPIRDNGSYNPAGALTFLLDKVSPGDVVLIEQQTPGPNGGTKYVPLEWVQSSFDAIKALSGLGVVVVETGGNGGENLDDPAMLGRFDRNVRDSDAILVGAGDSVTHAPLSFTSRGFRVDLQGYGNNVVTAGGNGNLQLGPVGQPTARYTRSFGGTSSAGPIVVNAVAAVLSYRKATGQPPMTADAIVDLLRATGTPQASPGSGQIGPLPDTAAALRQIEIDPPTVEAQYATGQLTITADDGWGKGVDKVEYRLDAGPWQTYTTPITLPATVRVEYRASDLNGNVSATETFILDAAAPTAAVVNPAADSVLEFGSAHPLELRCQDTVSGIASCVATDELAGAAPRPIAGGERLPTDQVGRHRLNVSAADRFGNTASGTLAYAVAPDTTVKAKKSYRVRKGAKAKVKVGLGSLGAATAFECRVGAEDWQACEASTVLRLKRGRYELEARAVDASGVADPTPALATLKVKSKRKG